ncbi:MAG TPA: S-methyl-5'-thioadenosine phosphorylase [Dehalococcoidia bacterium]|nr:S-methyl-5'-thioadenosine phosphorylase [Dehalococcoidia bacterium]
MTEAKIGVIGGSGLYQMEGMTEVEEIKVKTPFGEPSDAIILGNLEGVKIAFLPRHGKGHRISPTELPVRANIYALKSLGVDRIISVAAVGSLKEKIKPLDIVIPDQIIDRTMLRPNTFFGRGIVGHIPFAEPFCPVLSGILYELGRKTGVRIHDGGTCIIMEGPQFSTRAESELYRSWGADIIFMTALPEAKLAREAEICYASFAIVTDYDCWNETSEPVSTDMILANLKRSIETAKQILRHAVTRLPETRDCNCANALQNAIITPPELIPAQVKKDLEIIIGKYIK